MKPAPGEASFHLLKMLRSELMLPVRTALHEAKKRKGPARKPDVKIRYNELSSMVDLEVIPVAGRQEKSPNFLVLFSKSFKETPDSRKQTAVAAADDKEEKEVERLRRELTSTQEYMRSMIEDQEAASEELRAANEEILSSNEELQSTNEELETAKEELQSSNEELTTLNEELQHKNEELGQLANDLTNLLMGVEIPIVILGSDRRIRRFTPSAEKAFNLISSDVGRPIGNIKPNVELPELDEMITHVLEKITPLEVEVQDKKGRWYSLRIRPYKTNDNKIDGVLLALGDIDVLKRNLERVTKSRDAAESEREGALQSLGNSEIALRRSEDQLRALAASLLTGEEQRSRRLAFELQENIGQRLTAVFHDLAAIEKENHSSTLQKRLDRARSRIGELAGDIETAASRLHPSFVETVGLAASLREQCSSFSRKNGIKIKLTQRNVSAALDPSTALALYRIVQESLANIAQHSRATKGGVSLTGNSEGLRLTIRDNGAGFYPDAVENAVGLTGMRQRARLIGGNLRIDSKPGKGTKITVDLPGAAK